MNCESCGHDNVEGARFCAKCGVALQMESHANSWVGKLVGGRFRVTRILGEGGMGVVYAGEQQMGSTVRKVAIKTLHQHLSRDPSILARFHRECGTVAQLEHPNTIKVYDFGSTDDGTLYIAMEFVEGRSLDKVIEAEGPLAPARVVTILDQVCGALDEAHDKGIVHRDLKPENIVLGERLGNPDFVKVLDFGIAARSEAGDRAKEQKLTQQGMVLGTPPYMSPEQFMGHELDRRSDIYSLGVMAYEMLTGRLPFRAETAWQWATEHMTAQPYPIEQTPSGGAVPRAMRDVVMRALSKKPEERQRTANQFVHELDASVEEMHGALSVARTEMMQAAPTGPRTSVSEQGSGTQPRAVTNGALAATQGFELPVRKSNRLPWVLGAAAALGVGGAAFALIPSGAGPEIAATGGGGPASGAEPSPPSQSDNRPATGQESPASGGGPSTDSPPSNPTTPSANPDAGSGGASSQSTPGVTASGGRAGTSTNPGKTPSNPTSPANPTSPVEPTKPPVSKGPDCGACPSLAASGQWAQAALAYAACDAAGKSQCTSQAKKVAPAQVEAASGNCSKVRTIERSLSAMGARLPDRPKIREILAKCK